MQKRTSFLRESQGDGERSVGGGGGKRETPETARPTGLEQTARCVYILMLCAYYWTTHIQRDSIQADGPSFVSGDLFQNLLKRMKFDFQMLSTQSTRTTFIRFLHKILMPFSSTRGWNTKPDQKGEAFQFKIFLTKLYIIIVGQNAEQTIYPHLSNSVKQS